MAYDGQRFTTVFTAADDLTAAGGVAIAINDNKLANNGTEAVGILIEGSKPNSGQHGTIAYCGEIKYRAGKAMDADAFLTVTTSGYFTLADSNDTIVGRNMLSVTSGSLGTGIFNFGGYGIRQTDVVYAITAADALSAGKGYTLQDNKLANNGGEFNGTVIATVASGSTGFISLGPILPAVTLADSYGAGHFVTCTTSGYFTTTLSGYAASVRLLTAAASGANAIGQFIGGHIVVA